VGSVLFLEAGEELSAGKAVAGDLLYLCGFACWISRAAIRISYAVRGDREREELRPALQRVRSSRAEAGRAGWECVGRRPPL
jgi:hypothetical protein